MTIPLDRLRDFELTTPGPGQISIAVARHEAANWPSPEVDAYARHRAQLIEKLVEDTQVRVVSWGDTKGPVPREVVEVILAVATIVVPGVSTVLAGWLSRPRRDDEDPQPGAPKPPANAMTPLPGITIKDPRGKELHITYQDGRSRKEILEVVKAFLHEGVGG